MIWGAVAHLGADWMLQNEWMAKNKQWPDHLAAWVHAGIHFGALCLVFPPLAAGLLGVAHLFIDTRRPLQWWRAWMGQTTEGPMAVHVAIWGDQVAHLLCVAVAALLCGAR